MKLNNTNDAQGFETVRTIARFGQALLVKTQNGHYQLRGGTERDWLEAREWISLFMHEAVPSMVAQAERRKAA
jgi:hypothetical protein